MAGAVGALGIILALTSGGKPSFVMPLVFGFAPIVNVIATMYLQKIPWQSFHPVFLAGLFMVSLGAALVLIFKPSSGPPAKTPPVAAKKVQGQAQKPSPEKKDVDQQEKSS